MFINKYFKVLLKKMKNEKHFSVNNNNFVNEYNPKEKIKIISNSLQSKIKEFQENPEDLIIVTDFDYTLTKKYNHTNLKSFYSSYCVLESNDILSEEYKTKNKELFEKYYPYECDTNLDFNIRNKLIFTWFKDNLNLILKEDKITKESFKDMVVKSQNNFYYRYGILELFEIILKYKIKLIIISGGVYDIIEESLKLLLTEDKFEELKKLNLLSILSNQFEFDEKTKKIKNTFEPFVYTFNKGDILEQYLQSKLKGNETILLLGDHINDVDSIKKLKKIKQEIKIGFINTFKEEEHMSLLEAYQLHYDICILNDGNLTYIVDLIKQIFLNYQNKDI